MNEVVVVVDAAVQCVHVRLGQGRCKVSVMTWAAGSCETELTNVLPVRGVTHHQPTLRQKKPW